MQLANWLTNFGQAEIVLPACFLACLYLYAERNYRTIVQWMMPMAAAFSLALVSKLAYLGWGLGCAALDFTGISGHALSSAAIYPVLFCMLTGDAGTRRRNGAAVFGYLFAFAIAASRVAIGAHSPSEALVGFALGAAVSKQALQRSLSPMPSWSCAIVFGWIGLMPIHKPPSHSHELITRLALHLSSRTVPYTRADLHRLQA